jgi:hypothetical protein
LLERGIKGKVWFFGGILKATYDFAKKTADFAHENFSPTAGTGCSGAGLRIDPRFVAEARATQ